MKRRLEFVEGTSSKFYEVEVSGNAVSVTFGRIGTAGQMQAKHFANAAEAQEACRQPDRPKAQEGLHRAEGGGLIRQLWFRSNSTVT
jgi:predicted DNA-binding WGR domain protein